MSASFNDLSSELIDSVLKLVPVQSLPSVSLVCRTWHAVSFPLIYHTVNLGGSHAEALVQRLLDERDDNEEHNETQGKNKRDSALRVAGCVRRVYVNLSLDDEKLSKLGKAILKMKSLEHLHWDTLLLDGLDWHTVLGLLHDSLPGLRSLNLILTGVEFPLGDSENVVALTNVRELTISFEGSLGMDMHAHVNVIVPKANRYIVTHISDIDYRPADNPEVPTVIVDLIRGAANLEILNLQFQEDKELPHTDWFPVQLFEPLVEARFPNLRSLQTCASELIPIDFYDGGALRRFIRNHPQMHTVVLEASAYNSSAFIEPNRVIMTPGEMVELFPSVRHFEGPCVMVEALLRSNLADQVEALGIIESYSDRTGHLDELLPLLDSSTTSLPRLKVLKINSNTVTWEDTLAGLVKFAPKMPVLEEFIMGESLTRERAASNLDECLETLKSLPQLRTLAIPLPPYALSKESKNQNDKSFFLSAAAICSQLESVHYRTSARGLSGRWDVIRQLGEPVDVVDVVYMRRHGHFMPASWSDGVDCTDLSPPRWLLGV